MHGGIRDVTEKEGSTVREKEKAPLYPHHIQKSYVEN